MHINSRPFKVIDYKNDCFRITTIGNLGSIVTEEIRSAVKSCITKEYPAVYLDVAAAQEMDLSGINEVIHAHYTLQQANKTLVFVYRRNSAIEKWVETTGIDKFIATALLP